MTNDNTTLNVLEKVLDYYLNSGDFNGTPIRELIDISSASAHTTVIQWIQTGNFDICLCEHHINPHINRLGFRNNKTIIEVLPTSDLTHAVLYPSAPILSARVNQHRYADRPYDLQLALGAPQLSLRYFGLEVLDWYRLDPRYYYHFDDIRGWIGIGDNAADSPDTMERDKAHLETFGVAYDAKNRPVVCTFLRYLADLDPQHQKLWHARELEGSYKVHPDYIRNTIDGEWGQYVSLYDATLMEMHLINEQCKAIGWNPLFRNEYGDARPRGFGVLLRPTREQYNQFCHILDKLLSENLNREFFDGQVPIEEEITRRDGRIEVRTRGTITLLEDWLKQFFRTPDPEPLNRAIKTFKLVRKERQPQAHAISEDQFDYTFIEKQRTLIGKTYGALRTIRLVFANHPAAESVVVPKVLLTGKNIWPL